MNVKKFHRISFLRGRIKNVVYLGCFFNRLTNMLSITSGLQPVGCDQILCRANFKIGDRVNSSLKIKTRKLRSMYTNFTS